MSTAIISIDPRKYRMRFYKTLLQELGSPKYIHLLVNPDTRMLAVRSIPNEEPGCITINSHVCKDNSYEIYSFALTQQLFNALGWTDRTTCYRLRGEVNQAKKIALFAFDNVEKVELEA